MDPPGPAWGVRVYFSLYEMSSPTVKLSVTVTSMLLLTLYCLSLVMLSPRRIPPCWAAPIEVKYLNLSLPPLIVSDCLDCLAGASTNAFHQSSGLLSPLLNASTNASGKSGGVPSNSLLSLRTFIYSKAFADLTSIVGDSHDWLALKLKLGLPLLPRLVVTSITPPADCAP